MNNGERGDLILPQGTYAFIQDGANGIVEVVVGPYKTSLAETDRPVIQSERTMRFDKVSVSDAISTWKTANEGQYIILKNPVKNEDTAKYPKKSKQQAPELSIGNKVNVQGPVTFALFPDQFAHVINGHDLKSNEYLVIRVYSDEAAKMNLKTAVIKTTDEGADDAVAQSLYRESDIVTGKLMIIKGTDVSFYIPPTGIEVLKDEQGDYVRKAVTLERLEYCILLDQNGDKRYVKGPDVVFPNPTEEFIEKDNNRKFKALELNQNMGIYVKVIADYTEGGKDLKTGEELFITGKEQKIYYPRPEHALISYNNQRVHYAVALPEGEGRYVLDKDNGNVNLVRGPKMFLADPRSQVIVKRVLSQKNVELMYPGNQDAAVYNRTLETEMEDGDDDSMLSSRFATLSNSAGVGSSYRGMDTRLKSAASFDTVGDMSRSAQFTKPRTVTLDNKYEGAVKLNIWPGYAVQVVKQNGKRQVVEGPATVLLEYDEFLDILALSTGKPKTDHDLAKTTYLQTKNNVVSDIVKAETEDFVNVDIRISYRVHFTGDNSVWFNVSNYIKLLTQHLRSIIRSEVKSHDIESFNENSTNIIRDIALGKKEGDVENKGKLFEENNMLIYDVEVLDVNINDHEISQLLRDAQRNTVQQNLLVKKREQDLKFTKRVEDFVRQEITEKQSTAKVVHENSIKTIEYNHVEESKKTTLKKEIQIIIDEMFETELAKTVKRNDEDLRVTKESSEIETAKIKERMEAVSPKLVEVLGTLGSVSLTEILAKNLTYRTNSIFGDNGGMETFLDTVKGTPIENTIKDIMKGAKVNGD